MATLLHDIEHHAKDKAEIVKTLSVLFASELNPIGWQALRANKANNSWRIYLPDPGNPTKIWYFTGYDKGCVTVRNDYFWKQATRVFKITSRVEAIRFVKFIKIN